MDSDDRRGLPRRFQRALTLGKLASASGLLLSVGVASFAFFSLVFFARTILFPTPLSPSSLTSLSLEPHDPVDLTSGSSAPRPAKLAFLFLTRGALPLEKLWDRFFLGHTRQYSIYVHASNESAPADFVEPSIFAGRFIPGAPVLWGGISVVDAERKLLAYALMDPSNTHFLLVSETCIPLYPFHYILDYVTKHEISYVDVFHDEYKEEFRRYIDHIYNPYIPRKDFIKGNQWFILMREHAEAIVEDTMHYKLHIEGCAFRKKWKKFCCADEHYIQIFLYQKDPERISRYPTTLADWRQADWHPMSFTAENVTAEYIKWSQEQTQFVSARYFWKDFGHSKYNHIRDKTASQPEPSIDTGYCVLRGELKNCYLFARKFQQSTLPFLLDNSKSLLGF